MASKRPWRTIIVAGDTGRFTWEQIEAAVRKVKQEREIKAARAAAHRNSGDPVQQEA